MAADDPNPAPATMVARLCGLQAAAWLAADQHDDTHAAKLLEQSMLLRRALRETTGATNPLVNTARQARTAGQYHEAIMVLEEATAGHAALRERLRHGSADLGLALYDLGLVLRVLGLVRREQGQFDQAAALFAECVQMHRRFGDREGTAFSLLGLADVARDQGDAARVRLYGLESLTLFRDLGVQWASGFALNTLAQGAAVADDYAQASDWIHESIALFRDLKAYSSLAEVLIPAGALLQAQGETSGAAAVITEALRLAWAVGPQVMLAAAMEWLASLLAQQAQLDLVVQLLAAAAALHDQMGTLVRPVDQGIVDAACVLARSALGEQAFAACWQAAQALPLEHILAPITSPPTPALVAVPA